MSDPRFCSKRFIPMLVTFILAATGLTLPGLTAFLPSLAGLYGPAFFFGMVCFMAYLVVSSMALKSVGRSPWLALTGLPFGPLPLILYLVLSRRSEASSPALSGRVPHGDIAEPD